MSLTSDEVNFLVYRYLLEAGKCRSSFAAGSMFGMRQVFGTAQKSRGVSTQTLGAFAIVACHQPAWQPAELYSRTRCLHESHPSLHPTKMQLPAHTAGFTHAAFVFGCESSVSKSGINGKEVPVGALVSFIQKVCPPAAHPRPQAFDEDSVDGRG